MEKDIINLIATTLKVEDIDKDTIIGDLPEWDSLHHLQIIAELEKVYNLKFSQDALAELEDISDLVSLVEEMQGK